MRILITGGAGFIGRSCAAWLTEHGHFVSCIDNFSTASAIPPNDAVSMLDVRDLSPNDLNFDVILHLAALKSVPGSFNEPEQILHNVGVDHHILRAFSASTRTKRLVMASSCEIYGERGRPASEWMAPNPRSPYAVGKVSSEYLASVYRIMHPEQEICVLRLHNIFGSAEGGEAVISAFIDAILERRPFFIQGTGNQARDFTHIDDASKMIANVLLDRRPLPQVLNIGSGAATSVAELAQVFHELSGGNLEIEFSAERVNEVESFVADMTLYESLYGGVRHGSMRQKLADSLKRRAVIRGINLEREMAGL